MRISLTCFLIAFVLATFVGVLLKWLGLDQQSKDMLMMVLIFFCGLEKKTVMKIKSALRQCRNAEEVEAEVRRISETCVTHKPKTKLRWRPLVVPSRRQPKVFHPWDGGRNWSA